MTYTEVMKEEVERKEYVQIRVQSPVNPHYIDEGWEIISQELPAGMATLRKPLPEMSE